MLGDAFNRLLELEPPIFSTAHSQRLSDIARFTPIRVRVVAFAKAYDHMGAL